MEQVVAEIACEVAMRLMLEHGVYFQLATDTTNPLQHRGGRPAIDGPQLLGFAQVAWDAYQRTHQRHTSPNQDTSVRTEREHLEAQLFDHLESQPELGNDRSRRIAAILVEETLRHARAL